MNSPPHPAAFFVRSQPHMHVRIAFRTQSKRLVRPLQPFHQTCSNPPPADTNEERAVACRYWPTGVTHSLGLSWRRGQRRRHDRCCHREPTVEGKGFGFRSHTRLLGSRSRDPHFPESPPSIHPMQCFAERYGSGRNGPIPAPLDPQCHPMATSHKLALRPNSLCYLDDVDEPCLFLAPNRSGGCTLHGRVARPMLGIDFWEIEKGWAWGRHHWNLRLIRSILDSVSFKPTYRSQSFSRRTTRSLSHLSRLTSRLPLVPLRGSHLD
jgi:hypothetical protein